ncbi:MAG: hypothetical protein WA687_03865 [Solirubrobacterales bacterium]
MEAMRESWTDRRLDDFAAHTNQRFDAIDKRFDRVDADIRELRTEMNTRFDAMQRTTIQFGGIMIVALIGLIAAQVGLFVAVQP